MSDGAVHSAGTGLRGGDAVGRPCSLVAKHPVALAAALLFLFSLILYAGSLKGGFVWDDEGAFVHNPAIRNVANIPSFFATPLVLGEEAGSTDYLSGERIRYYRPLLSTLHVFEYRWFGVNPFGYRLVNLLLNGAVVVCAFLLVRALTGELSVAFLAALLYAANPVRGEVVYWAYSDSHILTALCSLLALLAYHRSRNLAALGCMAAALLFQESAILLPVVLLAWELALPQEEATSRPTWQRLLPFFLLAGVYLVLRRLIVGALPVSALDPVEMLRAVAYLLVKCVEIFFVTDAPVTMYRYIPGMFGSNGVVGIGTFLQAGLLLGLGVFLWFCRRGGFFWYAWFGIWIAVVFNVGRYANYLMAEKVLYLAALGPCVLLALPVRSGRLRWPVTGLLLVLVCYQAVGTAGRARYWTDTATYLEKLLEFEPGYDVAHYQLGGVYLQSGRNEKAAQQFEAVLKLRPDLAGSLAPALADAYTGLGQGKAERRDYAGALAALEKARQLQPGRSAIYNGLGIVHFARGNREEAVRQWQRALQLDPGNAEARHNLISYGEH